MNLETKLGFATKEGIVKVKDIFKSAYCQVLNGVLTLYKDEKHFIEYQKRWFGKNQKIFH